MQQALTVDNSSIELTKVIEKAWLGTRQSRLHGWIEDIPYQLALLLGSIVILSCLIYLTRLGIGYGSLIFLALTAALFLGISYKELELLKLKSST